MHIPINPSPNRIRDITSHFYNGVESIDTSSALDGIPKKIQQSENRAAGIQLNVFRSGNMKRIKQFETEPLMFEAITS